MNIDLAVTGAAPITDLAQSLDVGAPFMLIDAETGAKQLMWWERDVNGATIADQPIIGRVAKNLQENHRYIVAVRNAKNSGGGAVSASAAIPRLPRHTTTGLLSVEARRAHMEDIFTTSTSAGVTRSDLYLAWDFTTQSSDSTSETAALRCATTHSTASASDAPAFVVNTVDRAARCQHLPPHRRYLPGSALPQRRRRTGLDACAPTRRPSLQQRRLLHGELPLHDSVRGHDRRRRSGRAGACLASTATDCSAATRSDGRQRPGHGERAQLRRSARPTGRHSPSDDVAVRRQRRSRILAASRPSSTASTRAC